MYSWAMRETQRSGVLICWEWMGDEAGLVGKAEGLLLKEEAVKVMEQAFEAGGRSNRDVSLFESTVFPSSSPSHHHIEPTTSGCK
jgi:hypothetical protein